MPSLIPQGAWVEIHAIVLPVGERSLHLPEDTQAVPLEMRVKGFLAKAAALGDEAEIRTPSGRRLQGRLLLVSPPYEHGFGPPIPELAPIGLEVRALLRGERS